MIEDLLTQSQRDTLAVVRRHAEALLNHTPRFKFFTLHGSAHIGNLFSLADLFLKGGFRVDNDEAFVLGLAICIHDLGMVVPLRDCRTEDILSGMAEATDPAALELYIRDRHHEMAVIYTKHNFNFLTASGLNPTIINQVIEVSRCHRKVDLDTKVGLTQYLGAWLRVMDELDLGANRAPIGSFLSFHTEMDATSSWHWYKHNIVDPWKVGDNVNFQELNGRKKIEFILRVHPASHRSVPYWLKQIRRPIIKALIDERCQHILRNRFGVDVELSSDEDNSNPINAHDSWRGIEERAVTAGKPVVLVVDDEIRKLEDNFAPFFDLYHVVMASTAKDALQKLGVATPDVALVDLQMPSGGIWSDAETAGFKATGIRLATELRRTSPKTKIMFLTGTHHKIELPRELADVPIIRKPILPDDLLNRVNHVFP